MAYPGDSSGPASARPAAPLGARLTPDEFERLAAEFKPSWEVNEAPLMGFAAMAPHEAGRPVAAATKPDVRPTANGTYARAPSKPTPSKPPEASVIVDELLTVAEMPPAVEPLTPTPAPTPFGPSIVVADGPRAVPPRRAPSSDRLTKTIIIPRALVTRPSVNSRDGEAPLFPQRSKAPLWVAIGVGAVALAAVGMWSVSRGTEAPAPAPAPTALSKPAPTQAPEIPAATPPEAPPPVTAQMQAPKTVPISALAQVPAPTATNVAQPMHTATAPAPVAAPPRTVVAPAPAPRPAARPKSGGGTIVHDVPF